MNEFTILEIVGNTIILFEEPTIHHDNKEIYIQAYPIELEISDMI